MLECSNCSNSNVILSLYINHSIFLDIEYITYNASSNLVIILIYKRIDILREGGRREDMLEWSMVMSWFLTSNSRNMFYYIYIFYCFTNGQQESNCLRNVQLMTVEWWMVNPVDHILSMPLVGVLSNCIHLPGIAGTGLKIFQI